MSEAIQERILTGQKSLLKPVPKKREALGPGGHGANLRTLFYDSSLLFTRSPLPMWVIDAESLAFRRINRSAMLLYGYSKRDFVGLTAKDIRPPEDLQQYLSFIERVKKSDQPLTFRDRHITQDGSLIDVESTHQLVRFRSGLAILVLINDVSERLRFEAAFAEADRRYQNIFDNAVEGIFQSLPSGRFINVNPAFARMFNYDSPEEFCRQNSNAAILYVKPELRTAYHNQLAKENVLRGIEFETYRKDGTTFWISVNVRQVRDKDGKVLYFEGSAEDITARRLAEERLQTLNQDLERQAQELARSNSELQQFAYAASHDLQEPLRMISSYLELVARRYYGQLDKDADEFIQFAVSGAKRMKGLIDDLLVYSRLGRGNESRGWCDGNFILKQAMQNLQLAIRESGATINAAQLPELYGSKSQLVQLFQNLISNALKFRKAESPQIDISVEPSDADWLFTVTDNGIGLNMTYSERIFRIFQRLHARDEYPGTGIGLAICKKIVEWHQGNIWVESTPELGSSFKFTLPREGPPSQSFQ